MKFQTHKIQPKELSIFLRIRVILAEHIGMEEFLSYIAGISPLRPNTLETLQKYFEPVTIRKHDFFVKETVYARKIGFLKKGIVRAYFLNQEGKEYNKQFFTAPSIIGAYTSLLTKQPNKIAQQALTDCEVLVADYHTLEKLYDTFHDFERLGRKIAEFYFLEKEQKELEMALLDADKRYLLMQQRFPDLEAQIPQYHIASYLGISPTQLSRIRSKAK